MNFKVGAVASLITISVSLILLISISPAQAQVANCSNCHTDYRAEGLKPSLCGTCHDELHSEWENSAHARSLEAAGGYVAVTPSCQICHVESKIKENWGRTDIENKDRTEPITCEICHAPPEGGYFEHFGAGPHGNKKPEVTLAPENLCGRCHTGSHHPTIGDWNEYAKENFNPEEEESHSEPTESKAMEDACVACKSAEGGIKNLEKPEVYDFNEEELPSAANVEEWRITCAVCHSPHEAELRIKNVTQLCSNCHNSGEENLMAEKPVPAHHNQWEMIQGSIWMEGESHEKLNCSNCHMATREYDEEAGISAVTGHSFDVNAELLGSENLAKEPKCVNCHVDLEATIERKESIIENKIAGVESLKEEASSALLVENNSDLVSTYNEGLFYLSFVEHGKGIHNFGKASSFLDNSSSLLESAKAGSKELQLEGAQSQLKETQEKLEGKYGISYVIIAVIVGLIVGGITVWASRR